MDNGGSLTLRDHRINLSGILILVASRAPHPDQWLVKLSISKTQWLREQTPGPLHSGRGASALSRVHSPTQTSLLHYLPEVERCQAKEALSGAGPTWSHGTSYRAPLSDSAPKCLFTRQGLHYHSHFTNEVNRGPTSCPTPPREHSSTRICTPLGEGATLGSFHYARLPLGICWHDHELGCLHLRWQQWCFSVVQAAALFHYRHYCLLQRGVTLSAPGEL